MAENSTNSITAGKTITCKAAVTWGPKKGLVIEEIEVAPPKAGEVRIRIHYASLCHTDVTFLQLEQGIFPRIFGHEAAGVVESVGNGVTDLKEGDHVIPIFSGECGDCKYCASNKTNLCGKFRVNPMKAVMSYDNKPRFSKDGKDIFHFLSCSTFSEYTVLEEACVVKVPSEAPLDKICLFSCGVSTGLGAVWNTAKVEAGSTVAIFGLGTVGLAVAEGARIAGASRIIGVDIKPEKFIEGKAFGVTEFVNPQEHTKPIQEVLKEMTDGGVDYCFECAGNSNLMYAAFESCHDGWGQAILVGVDDAAKKIIFGCMQFFDGREIKGCTFGGYKGKTQIPGLVQMYLNKELNVERFITHKLPFERIDEAVELLEKGKSLRCVLSLI